MKNLFCALVLVLCASLPGCQSTNPVSGTVGITPDNATVAAGTKQVFTALVTGAFANTNVKWSILGKGCTASSCGTIDPLGLYTAPTSVPGNPSIQIAATIPNSPSVVGFANVLIAPPVGISINPGTTQTLAAGQSQPFTATVTNTSNTAVNWSVSGQGCTGVACGTITATTVGAAPATYMAPNPIPNPPTVTITATSGADPTKNSTVNVNLTLLVSVLPLTINVAVLHTQPFSATVLGSTNQGVNWSLSQNGAACILTCGIIDANGNYTAPIFVPNPATVTVTATAQADNTTQGSATVTVTGASTGAPGQLLGRYAFFYRGYHAGNPQVEVGSLLFDGNGAILAGSQIDQNTVSAHTQVAVTGSYVFDTANTNTGTITLSSGIGTTLKFAIVPHSGGALAATAYLTDFGGSVAGAGRLEAQDPAALAAGALSTGGYAMSVRGTAALPAAVGRFDLSGGNVSGGELGRTFADTTFGDCAGTSTINASLSPAYTPFTGSYGAVDTTTGLANLTFQSVIIGNNTAGTTLTSASFVAYVVSANEMFLIESDTGGYTFVGAAELQSTNNFQNASFAGSYSLVMLSNNGGGTGNGIATPITTPAAASIPASGNVTGLADGEYSGNLDGNLFLGLDIGEAASGGYYQMIQNNGLALAALCPGAFIPRYVMYFVSPQTGFVWNPNSNFSNTMLFPSDMLGEFDLQQGAPFGAQGQASINGTFAFGFEGVQGTFTGGHTATNALTESGTVTFTTTGTVDLSAQFEGTQQTGTVTFVIDQANGSGTSSQVTVSGTFTFNDDLDGNDDGVDTESFGQITYAVAPPFPVPDQFVVVSANKILFVRLSSGSNIGGVAQKQ